MSKEVLEILEAVEWALNGACYICKGLEPRHFSNCALKQAIILLKQQPKALDFAINCGAMGKGDDSCCGCIYWSVDGKLLCNECGTEFHLVEQQPPAVDFTTEIRNALRVQTRLNPEQEKKAIIICDRLDRAEAINVDLLKACKKALRFGLNPSLEKMAQAAIAKAEQVGK